MQKFRVWSILFFLPPLLTAFWLQLYIHVFILIGVIVASFVFHLSKEKKIARVDKFFAWALILSNLSLIASSNFKYPYALLAFAVVPIALAFYYSSRGKTKTVIIFINQIRMKIGVMFGNPETTPGGNALKFYSSVRIDIRKTAQIKKGEEVVGSRTKVKIVKNKIAAPFRTTEFDIIYNEGISKEGELIALGEKYAVLQKQGNSYAYGEEKLGRGYDATRTYLRENKKTADKVEKDILKKMKEEPISNEKQDEGEEPEE
jgi:hypothetical protein